MPDPVGKPSSYCYGDCSRMMAGFALQSTSFRSPRVGGQTVLTRWNEPDTLAWQILDEYVGNRNVWMKE